MNKNKTVWVWVTTHTAKGDGDPHIVRAKIAMQWRFVPCYGFWGI
jgi:hypothetical protein